MLQRDGLNRRAFLRNAGMTAVVSAVGTGAPVTAAAATAALAPPENGRYDFDTVYSRIGTDCTKWDRQIGIYGKDKIAVGMGIADMDFRSAPCITRALAERLQHENWGYLTIPTSHVESIVNWNKRRYGLEIKPEWIVHSPSVHPAILSVLRVFSPPGTRIIVQSPTYNAFYTDIRQVGCKAEENPLKLVNGRYSMDFEDLERRIDHDTNTLILCNPQNPTGNVWSRQDLMTLGEICTRRRVLVLADEIHCDFVMKGQKYTPYASLGNEAIVRNSITFKSASKSFNLAAMKCAYIFSTNADYLARVKAAGHREDISTLGVVAHREAYNEGAEWLDQLLTYIDGNHEFTASFISANMPLVKYVKPEGTYLAWIDVSAVVDRIDAKRLAADENKKLAPGAAAVTPETMVERFFVEHAKVHMNGGAGYGVGGSGRMRMNIGTSRKTLELALTNLATALKHV
jgi:cystathionine beta-lyase